jgi:integrase
MLKVSFKWNDKRQAFLGRYKMPDGSWKTHWLPKSITRTQEVEAQKKLLDLYNEAVNGIPVSTDKKQKTTIKLLSNRWLKLRYDSARTKLNTYLGLQSSLNVWILDNEQYPHYSIQDLDIEAGELTPQVLTAWIDSLDCARASKLTHIYNLKAFFRDCLAQENWLGSHVRNPMDKQVVIDIIKDLKETMNANREVVTLSAKQVNHLFNATSVPDYRKMRYLMAITCGFRDSELQALHWDDIDYNNNVIFIQRQLSKIGTFPAQYVDKLTDKRVSKADMWNLECAVLSNPKRNSKRKVPLHPLAMQALQWWHNVGFRQFTGTAPIHNGPVFALGLHKKLGNPGDYFMPESAALLRKDLQDCDEPLVDGIVFHTCRRTYATLLEETGLEREKTSALLGHGGATVASKHYIETNMPLMYAAVGRMALPATVQMEFIAFMHEPCQKV